jgi:hypothetical protein
MRRMHYDDCLLEKGFYEEVAWLQRRYSVANEFEKLGFYGGERTGSSRLLWGPLRELVRNVAIHDPARLAELLRTWGGVRSLFAA